MSYVYTKLSVDFCMLLCILSTLDVLLRDGEGGRGED